MPQTSNENEGESRFLGAGKMETIFEIDASENFTQNMQNWPQNECYFGNPKPGPTLATVE
jgi:hypothetical protein